MAHVMLAILFEPAPGRIPGARRIARRCRKIEFVTVRIYPYPDSVDAVDNARQKFSDTASKAQDRVARAGTDLETTIEHNPLVLVLIAMVAGIFVGMVAGIGLLSRGRA
jgi:CHASE3 domain sensor protein